MRPLYLNTASRSTRSNWLFGLAASAALVLLLALGSWLDLGGQEIELQAKLDERATWLAGFMDGRADGRQAADKAARRAFELGVQHGRSQACANARGAP